MRLSQRYSLAIWTMLAALVVGMGLALWVTPVWAQTPTPGKPVYVYLFWGDGCPHCAKAKPYLESLPSIYPNVVLRAYEVYYNQENQAFFVSMLKEYGIEQFAVPTIFIGPNYAQGYSEEMDANIEGAIKYCMENGCVDAAKGIAELPSEVSPTASLSSPLSTASVSPQSTATLVPLVTSTPGFVSPTITATALISAGLNNDPTDQHKLLNPASSFEIPLIGSVNLEMQPLMLSTALIALVDGFNPCSLWVLSMLLALTLHTGSRKKVFAIGLIFLSVTALVYALFIAGLFSVLRIASFLGWIQILVALVALFFALVNIKDYFWYKEGISFTIAEDKKSGIFKRIRNVINASQSFWGLASATVVLAVGVSMVEFSCTAGFPVIWVNLLSAQKVSGAAFALFLLLYMLIYQLDELVIFFSAVVSLKASRLEEKHGRLLKLIGGMLMLTLSVVMLVNPALMNNLGSSLMIFGSACLATLFVLFIHRVLLPKFGIRIGTEPAKKDKAF